MWAVSPQNDVWETTAEIPYWWWVTIQVWVVLLIGWKFASSNQKHYSDLGSDTSISMDAVISQMLFRGETSCGIAKCQLFSQAVIRSRTASLLMSLNIPKMGWSQEEGQFFWQSTTVDPLSHLTQDNKWTMGMVKINLCVRELTV